MKSRSQKIYPVRTSENFYSQFELEIKVDKEFSFKAKEKPLDVEIYSID